MDVSSWNNIPNISLTFEAVFVSKDHNFCTWCTETGLLSLFKKNYFRAGCRAWVICLTLQFDLDLSSFNAKWNAHLDASNAGHTNVGFDMKICLHTYLLALWILLMYTAMITVYECLEEKGFWCLIHVGFDHGRVMTDYIWRFFFYLVMMNYFGNSPHTKRALVVGFNVSVIANYDLYMGILVLVQTGTAKACKALFGLYGQKQSADLNVFMNEILVRSTFQLR